MSNPKWQDMKMLTDKDQRRRNKEREAQLAAEREEREKVAFRNKIVFAAIACVAVAVLVAAWFMVSSKREEIVKIKALSTFDVKRPSGTIQFKEANGPWSRTGRNAIGQGEGVSTVPDGKIDVVLQEERVLSLLQGTEFVVRDIQPLPDIAGVNCTAEMKKGGLIGSLKRSPGYVVLNCDFVTVKANPSTAVVFKVEFRKKDGVTSVRCAVREGELQVKYKGDPAIRLDERKELIVSADGKFTGPATIILGNEAWH